MLEQRNSKTKLHNCDHDANLLKFNESRNKHLEKKHINNLFTSVNKD